jgi:hypothetical protein
MARDSRQTDPFALKERLAQLISHFGEKLNSPDLRAQVLELVPIHQALRDLGSSLIPIDSEVNRPGFGGGSNL